MKNIKFTAILEKHGSIDAAYVTFPFDTKEIFGKKGQIKIKASIDGIEYRGSLAKMGTKCHTLGITKAIRQKIGKNFGDTVDIILLEDKEERKIDIPPDLQKILKKYKEEEIFFNSLSFTNRKEYVNWITEAKKEETRLSRLEKTIEKLSQKKKNPSEK